MFWRFLWWRSKKWFRERKMKKERRERRRKKKGEKMRDQKKEGNPWTLILSSPSFPSSSFLSFCTKTCHLPMIKVSLEDLSFCVLLLQSVFFFFLSLLILVPHHFLTPRGSSPSYFSLRRVIIFGGRLTAGFAVNQRINYNNNNNWKVQGENHEQQLIYRNPSKVCEFFSCGLLFPVSYISSSSWSPLPLLVCN